MHRPGHIEDRGEGTYAMDRRKYLSTLATGATFGAIAVGVASCSGSETKNTDDTTETAHSHAISPAEEVTGQNLWGYLRIFPHTVTRITDARPELLENTNTIRIPFYNNLGIDLGADPVVGFTLLTIGCPAKFALAINLTRTDHEETNPAHDVIVARNLAMDEALLQMGYQELPWTGMETTDCVTPTKP